MTLVYFLDFSFPLPFDLVLLMNKRFFNSTAVSKISFLIRVPVC